MCQCQMVTGLRPLRIVLHYLDQKLSCFLGPSQIYQQLSFFEVGREEIAIKLSGFLKGRHRLLRLALSLGDFAQVQPALGGLGDVIPALLQILLGPGQVPLAVTGHTQTKPGLAEVGVRSHGFLIGGKGRLSPVLPFPNFS